MRTLSEIIEATKDGQKPAYEECYYAMLALTALLAFERQTIHKMLGEEIGPFNRELWANESLKRNQIAYKTPPKEYVGWNNDPANPDYQKFRQAGKKAFDKFLKDVEN